MIQTSTRAARRRQDKNITRCFRYQENPRWTIEEKRRRIFQYFKDNYWLEKIKK